MSNDVTTLNPSAKQFLVLGRLVGKLECGVVCCLNCAACTGFVMFDIQCVIDSVQCAVQRSVYRLKLPASISSLLIIGACRVRGDCVRWSRQGSGKPTTSLVWYSCMH